MHSTTTDFQKKSDRCLPFVSLEYLLLPTQKCLLPASGFCSLSI